MQTLVQLGKRRLLAAMVLLGSAAIILLRVFDPATSGIFPPCPIRYLTGLYCPGCGSLRAMHALLHGELARAWAMNPLMIVMLPFVTYGLVSAALLELRGNGLPEVMLPAKWIRAFCVVVVLYAVARNLPLYPFDLLAPGAMLHL
jgi:Protein of unknown function (DUF2752)